MNAAEPLDTLNLHRLVRDRDTEALLNSEQSQETSATATDLLFASQTNSDKTMLNLAVSSANIADQPVSTEVALPYEELGNEDKHTDSVVSPPRYEQPVSLRGNDSTDERETSQLERQTNSNSSSSRASLSFNDANSTQMNDTSGNRTGSTLDHSLPSRPLSRLVENGITAETGDSTLEKQLTAELVNHETSFKIPASQDTTGSSKRISDTRSEPASLNNNDNNKTSPGSFREASDKKESYPPSIEKDKQFDQTPANDNSKRESATDDDDGDDRNLGPQNNNNNHHSRTVTRPYPKFVSELETKFKDPWYRRDIPIQTTSYLRPGSCFVGTQQSGTNSYEVKVTLKSVDMSRHFLSGYLSIRGLTQEHGLMETYFEGEMISPAFSFFTRRDEWNSSDQVDRNHWNKFSSWREMDKKHSINPDYVHSGFEKKSHIYMRWKEFFLVPDYRVTNLRGVAYDGFYYICFNQISGSISGVYYHNSSHSYQQLDLSHRPDGGTWPSYEFR